MNNPHFDNSSIMINGGQNISGKISISGSKNSSLPIIASSLLIDHEIAIKNVPKIEDVHYMIQILRLLDSDVHFDENKLIVSNKKAKPAPLPRSLTTKIRASLLFMGPLLTKFHSATISWPGGCNIGDRAIDMHVAGLTQMGAEFIIDDDYIIATTNGGLKGAEIKFSTISVGATQNIIMAATLAKGETIIHGASIEPEVQDLIDFLNQSGANITFCDKRVISIKGVDSLNSISYEVIPDRMEAATYLFATIATKGELMMQNVNITHLKNVLDIVQNLFQLTIEIIDECSMYIKYIDKKSTNFCIETNPYPGFPTDLQAQLMVLFTQLEGSFTIIENVFLKRFMHVPELIKMGARIKIDNNVALIQGPSQLIGTKVNATDLRASMALLIAGMIAKGNTIIENSNYIHRGYENIQKKLAGCSVALDINTIFSTL